MRGTVLHAPRDVRFEERDDPKIINPTDAIIRISATCVCGSDLWDYRGINPVTEPTPSGHEYAGIVEEVGSDVTTVKPGQFVIGSFFASDGTCPRCRAGFETSCQHREFVGGAQAELLRVPLADGTLVATPEIPDDSQRRTGSGPAGRPGRRVDFEPALLRLATRAATFNGCRGNLAALSRPDDSANVVLSAFG